MEEEVDLTSTAIFISNNLLKLVPIILESYTQFHLKAGPLLLWILEIYQYLDLHFQMSSISKVSKETLILEWDLLKIIVFSQNMQYKIIKIIEESEEIHKINKSRIYLVEYHIHKFHKFHLLHQIWNFSRTNHKLIIETTKTN